MIMKNKLLILLMTLFTCILCFEREVEALEYATDSVVVDEGYAESYLTFHHEIDSAITAHANYIEQKFVGQSTIIFEAEFGVTNRYVMSIFLNDSNTATMLSQTTYKKAILFGSCLGGYQYYDNGECNGSDISTIYNDQISDSTLFYAKTTFKITVSESGSVTVYAKLTESLETYLALGGNETTHAQLSSDFIELYTLEDFYSPELINNGYYIGFNVNMGKLLDNDMILYHLEVYDMENGLLFADNFSKFELAGSSDNNGTYVIPSNVVRGELGKSIVLTKGEAYLVPHFDISHINRVVSVGEAVDLQANLVNLSGDYTLTVTKDGEAVLPSEGMKYIFAEQGIYQLTYTLGDIVRTATIKAINKSTQPTVELNFSKEWNNERIDSKNSSIVDGQLKVADGGYFLTKGFSEGFILNLKLTALSDNAIFKIIVGKSGVNSYVLTLTETGIKFIDYEGNEVNYECENVLAKLSDDTAIYLRIQLLGGKLSYAAIANGESKELLNFSLVEIAGIDYVGQVGVEVTGGEASLALFQFVNMTSVKEDNTNVIAPPLKEDNKEEETKPSDPTEPENPTQPEPEPSSGCGGCKGGCGGSIVSSLIGLILLAAVAYINVVVRDKRSV